MPLLRRPVKCAQHSQSSSKAKSLATGAVNDAGGVAAARGRGSSEGAFHLSTPIHSSLPISHYSLLTPQYLFTPHPSLLTPQPASSTKNRAKASTTGPAAPLGPALAAPPGPTIAAPPGLHMSLTSHATSHVTHFTCHTAATTTTTTPTTTMMTTTTTTTIPLFSLEDAETCHGLNYRSRS